MSAQVFSFPERRVEGAAWEPWVDEPTLARHMGVSERTIRRWRGEGLPSKLRGGSRRYKITLAEQWLDQRQGSRQ